ncbi:ComEC/Rec2 family competence protein [Actinotalea sp. JY-7876]|uniref:ComEC/Rec2 family competence protein n=1 Tax=Actinotalea sp. JY-7876 TaxID=2758442 RepID=UPI002104520E|nr:ComEC/Rec2 family competence protein [Actinotalea sp. JY-7876]
MGAALTVLAAAVAVWARSRCPERGAAGPAASVVLVLLVAGAALLACGLQLHARASGPLPGLAEERAVVAVEGVVRGDPRALASPWDGAVGRWWVTVSVDTASGRGSQGPARAAVRVIGGPAWAGVRDGERVSVAGRAAPAAPGEEVVALVTATRGPVVLAPPAPHAQAATALRVGLLAATEDLTGDARALVPGAAVGDTSRVPPDLEEAMRVSGLTHVTAVSGAHFMVLTVTLLALTARLPRPARVGVCALVLAAFVLLVRPEPSVVRAAGMGALTLAGLALGRRSRALPALSASVVVLLLLDPWLARSYGFALSVLATGAIVVLAPVLVRAAGERVPRTAAVAVAVPVAAQAVCAPVLVLLDPAVSLVAVPANVLAAPAVAPATLLGLGATLAAPVAPPLARALGAAAGGPCWWIGAVARGAASVDGASLAWPAGLTGAALLAGATAAVLALLAGRTRALRTLRPGVVVVLCAVLLVSVPGIRRPLVGLVPGAGPPAGPWVAQCDVGQGDALVVGTRPGAAVVVDVGPDGDAADACLDRLGVDRIELLVLTHHHADHVGGLEPVLAGRTVDAALVSPLPEPAGQAGRTLRALADAGVPVDVGLAGSGGPGDGSAGEGTAGEGTSGEGTAGQVRWRVLWPSRAPVPVADALSPPREHAVGPEEGAVNDASLVLRLDAPGLAVLALGDLEPAAQAGLLAAHGPSGVLAAQVVKVAHHGSAYQDASLAQAVDAAVALVSVGADNGYGHPAASTLALYRATGAAVLATDECGTVVVAAEPRGLTVRARCPVG